MCPFPICPLYTQAEILFLDKPIADCFLFRPRKSREKRRKRSHTNVSNASVIWASRVSQTPLQAPFPTSINGYHAAKKFLSQWPAKRSTFAFAGESGYTLAFANRIAHSGLHAETGAFRTEPLSLPSDCFTRFGNPAWPGGRTAYFAAFESWSGVLPKNAESLGTAMRLCASLSRGVAAPLGCVIFLLLSKLRLVRPALRAFPRVRDEGGITTLGVLRVLLKRRTAACQNGSFAVF